MAEPGQRQGQVREKQLFDQLLAFLNSDRSEDGLTQHEVREQRGRRYEEVRRKQIRLFAWRGSSTPELLADKTFDRVMNKLEQLEGNYEGDPAHFVCGVGRLIYLESLHKRKNIAIPQAEENSPGDEASLDCLDRCMRRLLEPAERKLILEYYEGEKKAKIDWRRELAKRHGLSTNALRIECCRIRRRLLPCVQECVERQQSEQTDTFS